MSIFDIILFGLIKNENVRQSMISIVKLLVIEINSKTVNPDNLHRIKIILKSLKGKINKDWEMNVLEVILELEKSENSLIEILEKPEVLIKLKKIVGFKTIYPSKLISKEDILKSFLRIGRDPIFLHAFNTSLDLSGANQEDWKILTESLDMDPNLKFRLDHLSGKLLNSDGEEIQDSTLRALDIHSTLIHKYSKRGDFNPEIFKIMKSSNVFEKFRKLHWVMRFYHLSLGYDGNPFNVKKCHWIFNNKQEIFYDMLKKGILEVGLVYGDPNITEIMRMILKNSFLLQFKDFHPEKLLGKKILNPYDKSLFIVESKDFRLTPIIADRDTNFDNFIYKYPKENL